MTCIDHFTSRQSRYGKQKHTRRTKFCYERDRNRPAFSPESNPFTIALTRNSYISMTANFRLMCGPERRPSECSTQHFPAGTPHVGHRMEDNCLGVSSFSFI